MLSCSSMAVGTWELAFVLLFLVLVPVLIFLIVRAYRFKKVLNDKVITRGLSGVAGSTVNLTCPAGQKISIYRANYICTNPTANADGTSFESTTCDPFYSSGGQEMSIYNPATTLDAVNNPGQIMSQYNPVVKCNGQQKCSFTVPSVDPSQTGMCNGTTCTGTIQLVGTYDCVPE